ASQERVPAQKEVVEQPAGGTTDAKHETEDDGLVLSLPFDGSPKPEKGDAPLVEEGVTFDSEGARFSTDAKFVVPNPGLSGEAGTISFWLQPEWSGDDTGNASFAQIRGDTWENRLQLFKNGMGL